MQWFWHAYGRLELDGLDTTNAELPKWKHNNGADLSYSGLTWQDTYAVKRKGFTCRFRMDADAHTVHGALAGTAKPSVLFTAQCVEDPRNKKSTILPIGCHYHNHPKLNNHENN